MRVVDSCGEAGRGQFFRFLTLRMTVALFCGTIASSLFTCTEPVRPTELAAVVTTMRDTVVAVYDTVHLHARVTSETDLKLIWSFDWGAGRVDTTSDTSLAMAWGPSDTGARVVSVSAVDDDGTRSSASSFVVFVRLYAPVAVGLRDTTVSVLDTATFSMLAHDTNGHVTSYVWYVDDTIVEGADEATLAWSWGIEDTGTHTIRALVYDDDSIASTPCSANIRVSLDAPIVEMMADTAVSILDTLILRAPAHDRNGSVSRWYWSLHGNGFTDSSLTDSLAFAWGRGDTGIHVVRVYAIDDDGIRSNTDSVVITVSTSAPTLVAPADTAIFVNDTLKAQIAAADSNGTVRYLVWRVDDDTASDTSRNTSQLELCWHYPDTGRYTVRIVAVDDDTVASAPDSFAVTVLSGTPIVTFSDDSVSAVINDPITLHANAYDTNGGMPALLWAFDDGPYADTTLGDSLVHVWGRADTGMHLVRVVAMDDDSIVSSPDTLLVDVEGMPPSIESIADTLIGISDTLDVTIEAHDANGVIAMYYLDTAGMDGWDDSTTHAALRLHYTGIDTMHVVAGVRDDDTMFASDTFVVTFNHPPRFEQILGPPDTVSFWWSDSVDDGVRAVTFDFAISDSNQPYDSLSLRIETGSDTASLSEAYAGPCAPFEWHNVDTGAYVWRAEVVDKHGAKACTSGTLVVVHERRICFLGHSIVVGLAGSGMRGGFRKTILDSLAANLNTYEKVRPMGHMLPGLLAPASWDSCLARSGSRSYEMYDTLCRAPWVNADYWVIMLGVNSGYGWETRYLWRILDTAHARNPATEIYVLNGLPICHDDGCPILSDSDRDDFNTQLDLAVETRDQLGWEIHVVDAFTTMAVDSAFNDTLFADCLHPNQVGYERLADTIWQKMTSH